MDPFGWGISIAVAVVVTLVLMRLLFRKDAKSSKFPFPKAKMTWPFGHALHLARDPTRSGVLEEWGVAMGRSYAVPKSSLNFHPPRLNFYFLTVVSCVLEVVIIFFIFKFSGFRIFGFSDFFPQ